MPPVLIIRCITSKYQNKKWRPCRPEDAVYLVI